MGMMMSYSYMSPSYPAGGSMGGMGPETSGPGWSHARLSDVDLLSWSEDYSVSMMSIPVSATSYATRPYMMMSYSYMSPSYPVGGSMGGMHSAMSGPQVSDVRYDNGFSAASSSYSMGPSMMMSYSQASLSYSRGGSMGGM